MALFMHSVRIKESLTKPSRRQYCTGHAGWCASVGWLVIGNYDITFTLLRDSATGGVAARDPSGSPARMLQTAQTPNVVYVFNTKEAVAVPNQHSHTIGTLGSRQLAGWIQAPGRPQGVDSGPGDVVWSIGRGRPVLPAAQRGASCLVDHPCRGPLLFCQVKTPKGLSTDYGPRIEKLGSVRRDARSGTQDLSILGQLATPVYCEAGDR
eukprot:1194665-Prorocentrum_minimum.AAC.2